VLRTILRAFHPGKGCVATIGCGQADGGRFKAGVSGFTFRPSSLHPAGARFCSTRFLRGPPTTPDGACYTSVTVYAGGRGAACAESLVSARRARRGRWTAAGRGNLERGRLSWATNRIGGAREIRAADTDWRAILLVDGSRAAMSYHHHGMNEGALLGKIYRTTRPRPMKPA